MRKIIALVMVIAMMIPLATMASAETTTLTTTVEPASYTLVIPESQEITYGELSTQLSPMVAVNNESKFAVGKNLEVTAVYGAFTCESVSTTIPFVLSFGSATKWESGSKITFNGKEDGTLSDYPSIGAAMIAKELYVKITSSDWGKALAGDYTATITFTADVVAAE